MSILSLFPTTKSYVWVSRGSDNHSAKTSHHENLLAFYPLQSCLFTIINLKLSSLDYLMRKRERSLKFYLFHLLQFEQGVQRLPFEGMGGTVVFVPPGFFGVVLPFTSLWTCSVNTKGQ